MAPSLLLQCSLSLPLPRSELFIHPPYPSLSFSAVRQGSSSLRTPVCPILGCCLAYNSQDGSLQVSEGMGNWGKTFATLTSLYPVYILAGGFVAFVNPSAFGWFVRRGPSSYSLALGSIMLATGLSLRLEDLVHVVFKRPVDVLFGVFAQYITMPILGACISRAFNLSPAFSVGLILLACCPGGTASNVVTYIARGDVPLSVVMTVCTTFAAVFTTPLLTQVLAGAYVPVNTTGLAFSTLQVVFLPIVLGAWLQSSFPKTVARIVPFSLLVAVLISSLLASSVFSAHTGLLWSLVEETAALPAFSNVAKHTASLAVGGVSSGPSSSMWLQCRLVTLAVFLVHAYGFLLGYLAATLGGFSESQCRAISIEVGMQNSSLGVVLATVHFSSPLVAVPAAISAVIMNVMGSGLGVFWRHSNQVATFKHEHSP